MDELQLFAELAPPPPADAQEKGTRAQARLTREIATAGALTGAAPASRKPRRRRRRIALGIAAAAAGACAAIVVPAVLPGSSPTSFVTKAWAVQRNADGTVTMRITQFVFNGSTLQQALQAEGVPALVRFQAVYAPSYQVTDPGNAPGVCRRWPAARYRPRSRPPSSACTDSLPRKARGPSSSFIPRPCRRDRCCTSAARPSSPAVRGAPARSASGCSSRTASRRARREPAAARGVWDAGAVTEGLDLHLSVHQIQRRDAGDKTALLAEPVMVSLRPGSLPSRGRTPRP